jgi:hypothetical protein
MPSVLVLVIETVGQQGRENRVTTNGREFTRIDCFNSRPFAVLFKDTQCWSTIGLALSRRQEKNRASHPDERTFRCRSFRF